MTNDTNDTDGSKYLVEKSRAEQAVEHIQLVADQKGEPLKRSEYIQAFNESTDLVSIGIIDYHLGSDWEEACQKAGVKPEVKNSYTITDFCSAIKNAAKEYGEPLSRTEYIQWRDGITGDAPHPTHIATRTRLRTWESVCELANVESKTERKNDTKYEKEEYVKAVQLVAEKVGEPISQHKYVRFRKSESLTTPLPSINTFNSQHHEFDGWYEICEIANVEYVNNSSYTVDEIITAIQQAANDVDGHLTKRKYLTWRDGIEQENIPSPSAIINSDLGSWTGACETANIKHVNNRSYTVDEVITAIQQAANQITGPLTQAKYVEWRKNTDKDRIPTRQAINNTELGSWANACEAANIDVSHYNTPPNKYTVDEIITAIQQAANQITGPLTYKKYDAWRKQTSNERTPCQQTINNSEIGPWSNACETANIEYSPYHNKKHQDKKYSVEDITNAIQQAATEVGEPLSQTDYRNWRSEQVTTKGIPSANAIHTSEIGSWVPACEAANVEPGKRRQPYTNAEVITAIQQAANEVGEPLTQSKYIDWRNQVTDNNGDRIPSITGIKRSELGSWNTACETSDVKHGNTK